MSTRRSRQIMNDRSRGRAAQAKDVRLRGETSRAAIREDHICLMSSSSHVASRFRHGLARNAAPPISVVVRHRSLRRVLNDCSRGSTLNGTNRPRRADGDRGNEVCWTSMQLSSKWTQLATCSCWLQNLRNRLTFEAIHGAKPIAERTPRAGSPLM